MNKIAQLVQSTRFGRLKKKKAFTLVECLIALMIFSIMCAIVMGIISLTIKVDARNHKVSGDLDKQMQNITNDTNTDVKETFGLVFKFKSDELTPKDATLTVDEVDRVSDKDKVDDRLQIDTLKIDPNQFIDSSDSSGSSDSEDSIGGVIKGDTRVYGTSGLTSVNVMVSDEALTDDHKITIKTVILDTASPIVLRDSGKSVKYALPEGAYGTKVDCGSSNTTYHIISGTKVRISKLDDKTKVEQLPITITFYISNADYTSNFVSAADYYKITGMALNSYYSFTETNPGVSCIYKY